MPVPFGPTASAFGPRVGCDSANTGGTSKTQLGRIYRSSVLEHLGLGDTQVAPRPPSLGLGPLQRWGCHFDHLGPEKLLRQRSLPLWRHRFASVDLSFANDRVYCTRDHCIMTFRKCEKFPHCLETMFAECLEIGPMCFC